MRGRGCRVGRAPSAQEVGVYCENILSHIAVRIALRIVAMQLLLQSDEISFGQCYRAECIVKKLALSSQFSVKLSLPDWRREF